MEKNGAHQQQYGSSLKNEFLQISIIFPICRKKLEMKKYCFQQAKISFLLNGMIDWLKNMFQLKKKLLPVVAVDCCLEKWKKMWFPLARKSIFISLKMLFLLKLASTSFGDGFHQGEKPLKKRKRFPLAKKSVSTNRNKGFC